MLRQTTDKTKTAIGILLPADYRNYNGVAESLLTGFDLSPIDAYPYTASFDAYPYATIYLYTTSFGEGSRVAAEQFLKDSADADPSYRCFISGATTEDFRDALEVFEGTSVLVLSLGATYSNLKSFRNIDFGFSMNYSDTFLTTSLMNVMTTFMDTTKTRPGLYIVYLESSLYAQGFAEDLIAALNITQSDGPILQGKYAVTEKEQMELVLREIGTTFSPYDILVLVVPSPFVVEGFQMLNAELSVPYFLYLTDFCDGINWPALTGYPLRRSVYCSTVLQRYTAYTSNTSSLYKKLFTEFVEYNSSLTTFTSCLCPFAFDATRQLLYLNTFDIPLRPFFFTLRNSSDMYTGAALSSNWVIERESRPFYGHYFTANAYDDQWGGNHVSDFNKIVLGSSITQPTSCAVGQVFGYSQSQLPGGYYVQPMVWIDVFNKDGQWIFTKLPINGMLVDTSEDYASEHYTSQDVGTYLLLSQYRQYYAFEIEKSQGLTTIDFFQGAEPKLQYPIAVQSKHLAI